jgi:hypothetical protein
MTRSTRNLMLASLLAISALATACPPPWAYDRRHERHDDNRGDRHERHDDNRNERHDNKHERHDDKHERKDRY